VLTVHRLSNAITLLLAVQSVAGLLPVIATNHALQQLHHALQQLHHALQQLHSCHCYQPCIAASSLFCLLCVRIAACHHSFACCVFTLQQLHDALTTLDAYLANLAGQGCIVAILKLGNTTRQVRSFCATAATAVATLHSHTKGQEASAGVREELGVPHKYCALSTEWGALGVPHKYCALSTEW
jgi:hypothetical protein